MGWVLAPLQNYGRLNRFEMILITDSPHREILDFLHLFPFISMLPLRIFPIAPQPFPLFWD